LENYKTSNRIQETSINYTSYGEKYDHSTAIVNSCLSTIIAKKVLVGPDPKTKTEYKRHSDWNKWKKAIEVELSSLKKRKMFNDVIPTPPRIFSVGFKWLFIRKKNENN
jgi:hypothetical protein